MKPTHKLIQSAIQTVFILTATSMTTNAVAESNMVVPEGMERCYGIAKAGMNDCGTATQSCSGSSQKERDPTAYLFVPKGLCERIAGSSLQPPKENKK